MEIVRICFIFILELIHDIRLMVVASETRSDCTNQPRSQPRRLSGDSDLRKLQVHSSDESYRYVFVEL